MIYVAHATSPAIPNLMLYDRAASRYTYIRTYYTYVRIYYMYTCIYIYISLSASPRRTDYPPLT